MKFAHDLVGDDRDQFGTVLVEVLSRALTKQSQGRPKSIPETALGVQANVDGRC